MTELRILLLFLRKERADMGVHFLPWLHWGPDLEVTSENQCRNSSSEFLFSSHFLFLPCPGLLVPAFLLLYQNLRLHKDTGWTPGAPQPEADV